MQITNYLKFNPMYTINLNKEIIFYKIVKLKNNT